MFLYQKLIERSTLRQGFQILVEFHHLPKAKLVGMLVHGETRNVYCPIPEVVAQYKRVFNLQTKSVESRGRLVDTLHLGFVTSYNFFEIFF